MRLANDQGGDGHHGCRLPTDPEQDRQPENKHPGERTEEGSKGRQLDAWRNVCRRWLWVRASREHRRMDTPFRSVEDDPTQVRAISRADDIKVDGSGLRKLGSIDHGACLVIGVGAIGVEVEYRTGGNGAPGTIARRRPLRRSHQPEHECPRPSQTSRPRPTRVPGSAAQATRSPTPRSGRSRSCGITPPPMAAPS